MSNRTSTTITISRSKYDQLINESIDSTSLRNQVNNLTRTNGALQSDLDAARERIAQSSREYESMMTELRRQNRAQNARNAQLQSEINAAYENCNNRIAAHTAEVEERLEQMRQDTGELVQRSIEANNQIIEEIINRNNEEITAMVDDLREDTDRAITEVSNRLTNVHERLDALYDGADRLLGAANDYMDRIGDLEVQIARTRHEILLPGQYLAVQSIIDTARSDIALASGNPMNSSAAHSSARTAFRDALRFFELAHIEEQRWQAQLAATEQVASILAAQFESSTTVEPRPGVQLDVDFWSKEGLSENRRTFEAQREILSDPAKRERLTIEQLEDMQSSFREISGKVDGVVADALASIYTSQNVVNTAERIRRRLRDAANLNVIGHSYEGGDQRGNYRFILENPTTGMVVVITVSVNSEGEDVAIEAEADITDYGHMAASDAEALVREAIEAITSGVSGKPSVHCSNRGQVMHPERADLESWRRSSGSHESGSNPASGSTARKN